MNLFKKPIFFLALALLVIPKSGFAQYQFEVDPFFSYFGDIKRYEIGVTEFLEPFAHFSGVTSVNGNPGSGDTTATHKQPGTALGGMIGLSIPFKMTGHISCWAVDFHLMVNMYSWTDLNEVYSPSGSFEPNPTMKPLDATTLQIALPIGIEYKIGNDAIQSKRLAFGASFGLGVMPNYNMSTLTGVSGINPRGAFGMNPYMMMEFSEFLGFCAKFRVTYTMGDVTLINVDKPLNPTIDGPFKLVSSANLMASIIFMPFSGKWYEHKWYTTHDTYNQHDRLN